MHSLVHLSDLHLGSPGSLERARALVAQLEGRRDTTTVVTGDITSGRLWEWREYRRIFAPLQGRLVTLPGNHDRCHDDVARFITRERVWAVRLPGIHLVCVDSTAEHNKKPYRSHGALCERVLAEIAASLEQADPDALRVVALHHHVVPLPTEGIGEWFADLFGWPHAAELGLGPELLRRLLGHCDLVLHGHRHVPRELVADAANGRPLRVLNAGATLELGAYRLFDVAPGAYSHQWVTFTNAQSPLVVPRVALAIV